MQKWPPSRFEEPFCRISYTKNLSKTSETICQLLILHFAWVLKLSKSPRITVNTANCRQFRDGNHVLLLRSGKYNKTYYLCMDIEFSVCRCTQLALTAIQERYQYAKYEQEHWILSYYRLISIFQTSFAAPHLRLYHCTCPCNVHINLMLLF